MELLFSKKFREIIKRVGIKHHMTEEEGVWILSSYFTSMKESLEDARIPNVITPIGRMYPTHGKIRYWVKILNLHYKRGFMTKDLLVARLRRIFPVWKRLYKETNKERTWVEWNTKDKKVKLEKLRDDVKFEERKKKSKSIK